MCGRQPCCATTTFHCDKMKNSPYEAGAKHGNNSEYLCDAVVPYKRFNADSLDQ